MADDTVYEGGQVRRDEGQFRVHKRDETNNGQLVGIGEVG